MNYADTIAYLFSQLPMYQRIGVAAYRADLTNTIAICDLLGNPQDHFRSIHIAGTNGKGSSSHMIASVLQEKGLKTGLYTSPHLKDFRERILVNGKKIRTSFITDFVARYKAGFERIQPSFFEMTAGLAFDYFRQEKVDIAVIEVGMGGRLDSTNVITPLVSVITNISFDHMQFLGDTLEKIAAEKAGIIKPGVPVVIGETGESTRSVFIEKAKSTGSEILFADGIYSVAEHKQMPKPPVKSTDNHYLILDVFRINKLFLTSLRSPLQGRYQKKNIVTVAGVFEMLSKTGIDITREEIRRGIQRVIKNTHLSGRWQILSRLPLTICDSGHNEEGIKEVLMQIDATPHKILHFVFGVVNDKDIHTILELLPRDAVYYFCKADIPRGLDQHNLQNVAFKAGLHGDAYPSVATALAAARANATGEDLVFVGGSMFVVAEVV
ncbi:MAG: bifunctional folylpolyglutamate synthase/dihydrofolate synthase [Bacteroidetes bacterium]|nr:bifunctional folylpolyglutamate synthase/dihydrofolate synthase [Bacteroidota bacterium]